MSDRLSAVHEAGHATVAYLLGEMPERVSIRTEGNSLGHVAYLQVEADAIARAAVLGKRDVDRDTVMRNLVATACGPVAQAMSMGGVRSFPFAWTVFDGHHDYGVAQRLMVAAEDLLEIQDLDDVVEEAHDLLAVPRIWEAVERVARELMRYQEIGYEELRFAVLGAVDERKEHGHDNRRTHSGLRGSCAVRGRDGPRT